MAGLQPAHINSAPHATVGRMLKRQYHFRTQFILDSKRVRGCEAGLQKHTQVTSNEWSSFSSPSFRRQPAIKGRSKDSGASSFSEFMSIDACVSLPPTTRRSAPSVLHPSLAPSAYITPPGSCLAAAPACSLRPPPGRQQSPRPLPSLSHLHPSP